MASITYKIGKPRKDLTRRVSFLLSCKGKRMTLPGTVMLVSSDLSKKGSIVSLKKKHEIDKIMSEYSEKIYKAEYDLMGAEDINSMYSCITRPNGNNLEFFSFADEFLSRCKKYTYNMRVALRSLERYLHRRYLLFKDIDYRLLYDYCYNFLNGHPYAQSGYLSSIRRIYNEAMRTYNNVYEQPLPFSPFTTFKVPKQKARNRNRTVSKSVLLSLLAYKGYGRAQLARDCYLMSFCLMGMNSADLYDRDAVLKDGKICYHRKKTRDRRGDRAYIEIQVPEILKPLMKKYKGEKRLFRFYRKYSNDSNFNKNINLGLKRLAKEMDMVPFDFYSARHTWATIARNDLGVDKSTVNEALDHVDTSLRIADIYIEKDFKLINEANRKVVEFVFGKEAYSGEKR